MKASYAFLAVLLLSNYVKCQDGFKWETTGGAQKSKDQIYSDTKMFIAEQWKSAQDVIQNDDKDAGVILVKGLLQVHSSYSLNDFTYTYGYTVTFKMKDGKYLIALDHVYCHSAIASDCVIPVIKIEPFEGEAPKTVGFGSCNGIPKAKAVIMMTDLKNELQGIIDNYQQYIATSHDW